MGDALVLSLCSLIRNRGSKQAGVLEHCHEGETNCWFSILRNFFFSDRIRKATKDVNVRFFVHSFTLREKLIIIPANSGKFLWLLRV